MLTHDHPATPRFPVWPPPAKIASIPSYIHVKPLYTARHATDAHLVCGYLESQGIKAIVRGEYLASGIGELPADLCKVWIANDTQFDQADALLQAFLRGDAARMHAHERWRCAQCSEELEGQFTTCWSCGTVRAE